jgi:hypothetical protein
MKRTFILLTIGTALLAGTLVADVQPIQSGKKVQFNELPAVVQNTVKAHAGEARIEDIDYGTLSQPKKVYEVAYKQNGRHTELRVGEDGTVIDTIVEGKSTGAHAALAAAPGAKIPYDAGFEGSLKNPKKVSYNTLPAHVRQIVQERKKDAKVEDVEKGQMVYGTAYQIAYKKNNKHVELRVSEDGLRAKEVADGQVVYWAAPIQFSQLPPRVQQVTRDRVGSVNFERVQHGATNERPFYRINYTRNGQPMELRLGQDGTVLQDMAVSKSWINEPAGAQTP